ncbi:LacI family DNA-binding transcriptional regulator [Pedobacter chitinilyticus]|uniref:LacI family transcriptional regulator n=1 Tax=Pedobacter chitinilyticus TaxID=2233776 RepID=A0A3S3PSR5_9SPHI|nr:LacI family DNA-binding transcriptional regulator [Pedobacter chitinilyticus]RWU05077.1 LacI family transcriptional regulator [Pedobacter chitinilyticus]
MKKNVTIKEIGKRLNLSFSTISRALHKHPGISLATQQLVMETADEMGYLPNQKAIFFKQGRTFNIGVILPELSESFFSAAISAIEDIAYKNNYVITVAQSHDDQKREKQMVEQMKSSGVDGLLVSVAKNTMDFDHFEQLKKSIIPVVYFDRIPPIENIHYVTCNIKKGSMETVDFLVKRGHKHIAFINGPRKLWESKQRKEGYLKGLKKNSLEFDPFLVMNCDLTKEGVVMTLETLLKRRLKPTAIIAFSDDVASFAIGHALKLGIRVNEEIEFASFANSPISKYIEFPPLASVEHFPSEQGQKAIDALLHLIQNNNSTEQYFFNTLVDPVLVQHIGK